MGAIAMVTTRQLNNARPASICVDRLDPRLIRGDAFISKCSFIAISSSVISFGSPVDVVSSSPTNTGVVERSLFVVNFFFFFSVFSPPFAECAPSS